MLTKMSDAQLQQLAKSGKYDPQVIQQELQRRAQIRSGGLAALPSAQEEYADGGIIGFAGDAGSSVAEEDEYGYLPGETIGERLKRRGSGIGAALASGARWLANPGARNKAPAGMDSKGFQASDKDRTPVDTPTAAGAPMPTMQASETKAPRIGATEAKPKAKATGAKSAGIASILKTKEGVTSPIAPPTAGAGTGFAVEDYATMGRNVNELSRERNSDTKAAYQEYQDQLKAERAELKGRDKQNINDALIRAGLGMMAAGGQGKSTLTALGEGATQGFGAYQDAKKLDAAALKANQNAQMLLMQAERAERSGNMRDATTLYAQARGEKATAAQLEMQARQLAAYSKHQEESLKVQREGHRISSANAGRNPQLEIYRTLGDGDAKKGYELAMQGKKEPMSRAEAMRSWEIAQYGKLPPGVTDFESYYRMMSGAAPRSLVVTDSPSGNLRE
jgi:hypothetical protein